MNRNHECTKFYYPWHKHIKKMIIAHRMDSLSGIIGTLSIISMANRTETNSIKAIM